MTTLQTIKPERFEDSMLEIEKEKEMVNLTRIAKASGKSVGDRTRLQSTKDLILAFESVMHNPITVKQGGLEQGTWATKDLALDFMQWVSPQLKVYCLNKLNDLFSNGSTSIKPMTPGEMMMMHAQSVLAIEKQISTLSLEIAEVKAKQDSINVDYYTISGYCSLTNVQAPLHLAQHYGKLCTDKSKEWKYEVGRYYDAKYGNVNSYHVDILREVIG